VWAAVVGALQGRGYTIVLSDKTAGVVTTDFKIEQDESWRHKLNVLIVKDGDETNVSVTSTVQNQRSNRAFAALSLGVVRTHEWTEQPSDGTRETELLQALTKRLQPGGAAIDSAEANCNANFTIRGAVIRGTTYETFEEFQRLTQDVAIGALTTSLPNQLTLVSVDKAAGLIKAQGLSPNGKSFTREYTVTAVPGGVRVNIAQKLPVGNRGDDGAVRNDLCQIISKLSLAVPKSATMPTTTSAPSQPSVNSFTIEERLRKLDELYQKHLITEEEYKKKRVELLSQM
jgi:hypothetical protein